MMIERASPISLLDVVLITLVGVGVGVGVGAGQGVLLTVSVIAAALLVLSFLSTSFSLYLLIFSMLLGPEFLFGSETEVTRGTLGRGLTLRFDDFLLVTIGLAWLVRAAVYKGEVPFLRTPLNVPIFLYVGVSVTATLIGGLVGRVPFQDGFFFNLKYIEYFFLYFMVVSSVQNDAHIKRIMVASFITCFLVSLFAIAQIPGGERVTAPFEGEVGEPNTLGGYLVFMMAIAAGLLLTEAAVPRRWPLVLLIVTAGIALMATLSRTSFLAGGVVMLLILGLTGYRRPLVSGGLLLVILSVPMWMPDIVTERVAFTFTQYAHPDQIHVSGMTLDTSTSARLRSWEESVDVIKASPLYGLGVTGGVFMDAMYPRLMTETGFLGIGAFGFLCWMLFRVGWSCYRSHPDPTFRGVALGFLLGFIGMLVHAVGANTFIIVRIMEPFWLYAALIVRMYLSLEASPVSEKHVDVPYSSPQR